MMEPNKPALLEWARALESGQFEQAKGQLGKIVDGEKKYCCLGVACVIFADRLDMDLVWDTFTDLGANGSWSSLPFKLANHLGVSVDPALTDGKSWQTASTWNDAHDATFADIAQLIRRTYNLEEDNHDHAA